MLSKCNLYRYSTDTDTLPYCDWMPGGWRAAWTETSCEEIPGVRCDRDGNVVELKVSEKGLRGRGWPIFQFITQGLASQSK